MNEKTGQAVAQVATAADENSARRRRRKRGRGTCLFGLFIGLMGLVGARLGHLWVAFDVFSQFTLQFAVINIAFLFGALMPRARMLMATVILVAGIAAIGVWPHYVSGNALALDAAKAGEREIRVASFNTWWENHDVEAVKAEIERLDADVIVLIELNPKKYVIAKELAALYPYQAECYEIDYCHMAIFAKFPIAATEARVDWEGAPMIRASFGPELGGLTVFGVHTIRFPHSRAQFRQIVALSKFLDTVPGAKIVMGDFNATPYSRIIRTLETSTGLKRLTELPSWPSLIELPQVAIDHIFASAGIRVLEGQKIGNPAGSDHYPIIMKLAVPVQ